MIIKFIYPLMYNHIYEMNKYGKDLKPRKDSLVALKKYANNHDECVRFFFDMKWPTGFYSEKCGCIHYYTIGNRNAFECAKCRHQHYLSAGTIFQDNKLDLDTLILGTYLLFTSNKGILAIELDVNYKTALQIGGTAF